MDSRRNSGSGDDDHGSWKDRLSDGATFKDWHIDRPKVNKVNASDSISKFALIIVF